MTSAIFWRTVSGRRAGLAAAGLVGALALTACGGGGSDDDASPSPSASVSSSASASASASGGTSSSAAGKVAGSWLATTTGGKAVALLVNGDQAGLFVTGGTVCSGSANTETIRLKCTDGSTERADGTVVSVGRTTLKVKWAGGIGTETYTRAEGGRLPSGLATAGAGS